MARRSAVDHAWDGSEQELTAATADACEPLEQEIQDLQEQIAVLEEVLPGAPGAQRAALAKEIAAYRLELDSRRTALRQCRGARR